MQDEMLQAWVEKVSLEYFELPFRHKATFNRRLTSTGGRYFTKTHNIEISPHQLENYGKDETEKIIKHELCHYHLHLLRRGYKHRDADFKLLLARVGGTRFCKSLPGGSARKVIPYKYKLVCRSCATEYLRKRKVDPKKFACGKCRGTLKIFVLDFNSHT
ncbi:protein SprT [Paenibacillus baekrokdamisoli]|uniref:Protein SprT n=1 Tax=Paenibacillus baekrokdamisoli TaxID=1712516 RepID=A0A3G9JFP0_9BACL|nr:SprT family protein [Paenibacillus baekrokdamisoli]MBB3071712.1 SprT-like protein [Paenibacillus baekrokdamisoli]BBH21779.1 protein SprT [Paenibacillus baekrokdamisoli]